MSASRSGRLIVHAVPRIGRRFGSPVGGMMGRRQAERQGPHERGDRRLELGLWFAFGRRGLNRFR
jgi:hypothetical protein